jgi:DNA repair protein RecO (recombination protein O)
MRITLQPAFVLHHRPYRESSLLLDLLTLEHGRVSAIARGVRTARSRTRALLQPFVPLLVSLQGKSELVTLSGVESQRSSLMLRGAPLLSAFYLNELLTRVLHKHDPHPNLYTIYHETLIELQNNQFQQKTLRIFEKKLLEELGYGLQLQYDIPGKQPIMADKIYRFIPEQGFTPHQEDDIQAGVFSGKSILALANEELHDTDCLRDVKRLMRMAFAPLLGYQPLHSRKLFVEVERK